MKTSIKDILNESGLVEVVEAKENKRATSLLCRLKAGKEKDWMILVDRMLSVPQKEGADFHICRRYLKKNGKMVFGWHISLTLTTPGGDSRALLSTTLERSQIPDVPKREAPKPVISRPTPANKNQPQLRTVMTGIDPEGEPVVIQEMPLPWSRGKEMNAPNRAGKGAHSVGKFRSTVGMDTSGGNN